jgi:hypothetical protein
MDHGAVTTMQRLSTVFIAVLSLAGALTCAAQDQDKGYWRAASNAANSITGDIAISNSKTGASLAIDYTPFPLTSVRSLKPAEVSSVFDADVNTAGTGSLYRLNVPASKRFVHRNTLCGTDTTQWMATYVSGRSLSVAFFSGDDAPVFTMDEISNSRHLCGTFTFAR